METTQTQTTCTAINCRCPWYQGVMSCDEPATHEYELRPGHWLPICDAAARQLTRGKLRKIDA